MHKIFELHIVEDISVHCAHRVIGEGYNPVYTTQTTYQWHLYRNNHNDNELSGE